MVYLPQAGFSNNDSDNPDGEQELGCPRPLVSLVFLLGQAADFCFQSNGKVGHEDTK
jgi:hypothetical protein